MVPLTKVLAVQMVVSDWKLSEQEFLTWTWMRKGEKEDTKIWA